MTYFFGIIWKDIEISIICLNNGDNPEIELNQKLSKFLNGKKMSTSNIKVYKRDRELLREKLKG